ncbi:MAG: hypothetical protein AB1540_08985 [Bdellovibrionota bacterium]
MDVRSFILSFVLGVFFSSTLLLADASNRVDRFDCQTTKKMVGEVQKLSFRIENLSHSKKVGLYLTEKQKRALHDGKEVNAIRLSSKNSPLQAINEETSVRLVKNKEGKQLLRLYGNSIDIHAVELGLYRDSGYRAGFIRIVDFGVGPGHPKGYGLGNHYSKLKCERSIKSIRGKKL